jgi:outer membrane protein assembly factor BamB
MHTLLLSACLLLAPSPNDNWTQFRGPNGTGRADQAGHLPIRWSETLNIRWKTRIHDKGWSSPVIWGDQIWLTTARADGKEMFVICVDRNTGKILHDKKLFDVAAPDYEPATNSYASPTPVIEAGRVYVHFGSYGTACLDTATGRVLWQRRDLPCNHWRGPASSPILYHNLLILQFDGYDYQYVVALDKKTGKTVWRHDRTIDYGTTNGDLKKAFSTPSIYTINGKPELLSPAAVATTALDPETGTVLWRVYHGGMNVTAPPQYGLGLVFLCTGDGGLKLLAVRPEGHGNITKKAIVWKSRRNVPSRSSPLLLDGLLYMVDERGIASCLDARTGRQLWQQRLQGTFFASPIYADGRLYFVNDSGDGFVLAPGRRPQVLAVNQLDDGCMASPAVSGSDLFLRTKKYLYCLRVHSK